MTGIPIITRLAIRLYWNILMLFRHFYSRKDAKFVCISTQPFYEHRLMESLPYLARSKDMLTLLATIGVCFSFQGENLQCTTRKRGGR
jgi:hypothetical protein